MAEPSLLCVSCARPPPPHRRTWSRCTVCVARNLPSTYYCGEECMNAHWPKHKVYHKAQKELAEEVREGIQSDRVRSVVESQTRRAERNGSEYSKRLAAALALGAKRDYHAAARAWRKIIKEWPDKPVAYFNLATALQQSSRYVEAAQMHLKSMELREEGTEGWSKSAAAAFGMLRHPDCDEVPKPEWWTDEALKALSTRVVALSPGTSQCAMRAHVLSGDSRLPWNAGPRTAAEIKEAATWYRQAALLTGTPAEKLRFERLSRRCDAFADPLLAEEEAEAAKARAATEAESAKARAAVKAEAAEALKVAEARAAAAAEGLLAEEEKEKQQASTKTKQGKKGKGNGKR